MRFAPNVKSFEQNIKSLLKLKEKSEMPEKKFEILVQIRAALTQQDIDAIMVSALEGGINYWCRRVVVQGAYLGEYASEQISRGGTLAIWLDEPFEDDKTCYMLGRDKFLAGFKLWLEKGGDSYDAIDYSDGSVDCGQIDATCADEIVQYALFGELVFG